MEELNVLFEEECSDTGHVKISITAPEGSLLANLTRTGAGVALQGDMPVSVTEAEMLVNAKVEMKPQQLEEIVRTALQRICQRFAVEYSVASLQSFSPGRPEPTWRYERISV